MGGTENGVHIKYVYCVSYVNTFYAGFTMVASMKAAVKRKICIEARKHAERQFQTASMLMRYEIILAL
jgi:hypothetical protein